MMSKGRQLKDRIAERGLVQAMAGHSPLSARLAAEAGFDAIWASGLELSALHRLPDVSLVSMSQHLETMRAMAESCALPVIADTDTGFGPAIHVIHAIRHTHPAAHHPTGNETKTIPKIPPLTT